MPSPILNSITVSPTPDAQLKICTTTSASSTKSLPLETTVQNLFKVFTKIHPKQRRKTSLASRKSAKIISSGIPNYFQQSTRKLHAPKEASKSMYTQAHASSTYLTASSTKSAPFATSITSTIQPLLGVNVKTTSSASRVLSDVAPIISTATQLISDSATTCTNTGVIPLIQPPSLQNPASFVI